MVLMFLSLTVMSPHKKLLLAFMLATGIPCWMQAQDGRLEINAAISTGGNYMLTDWDANDPTVINKRSDGVLSNLTQESYKTKVYPSPSVEIAYRLFDSGLIRHLSLVGMAGLHIADYEYRKIVDAYSDKQRAMKTDIPLGVRFYVVETTHLTLYSQAIAGIDFRNGSDYWTITNCSHSGEHNQFVYQITFAGFRVKLGHKSSHFGLMTELGYGSEYAFSDIMFLMPGMRAGISYRF